MTRFERHARSAAAPETAAPETAGPFAGAAIAIVEPFAAEGIAAVAGEFEWVAVHSPGDLAGFG